MRKLHAVLVMIFILFILWIPKTNVFAANSKESDLITITYIYLTDTKTVTIHSGETLDLWIPDAVDGASLAYWITNPGVPIPERNIVTSETIFYEDTVLYAVLNDPVVEPTTEEEHPVLDEESAKNLRPPIDEPTTYDVEFNSCNGSSLQTWSVEKNTAIKVLPGRPKKEGYIFLGWYTEENGGIQISVDTIITSDMTVYAHWKKIKEGYYTIIYNDNYESEEPLEYIEICTQFSGMPIITRKGYIFKGWYTEKTGGKKVKDGMAATSDMTLYAHWSKVTVKKAVIKSVKSQKKKTVTVKYKKISGAEGYQIQYSTSRKFTKQKTKSVMVKGNKSFTKNLTKLKKKTYYIRVRAYKKDSTKAKIYGKWSNVKKVIVKK